MRTTTKILAITLTAFFIANFWPLSVAAVTDEEFQQFQQKFQELQKQSTEDHQEINQLKQKLGETQKAATKAQEKAEESQKTATEARKKAESSQKTASEAQEKAEESQKSATEAAAAATAVNLQLTEPSEEAVAKANWLITGYSDVGYRKEEGENGTFLFGHFNPIFLYRMQDNLLFESEVEFELEDGETEVKLEYATIDYLVNDHLTLMAGQFILPLGVFNEKLHATWINKLPTRPVFYRNPKILPFSGVGVQARGAVNVDESTTLTYSAYLVNGPGADGMGDLEFNSNTEDNNDTPSGGGRIALLQPFDTDDLLEVGIAGQTGVWDGGGDSLFSVMVVDASYQWDPYWELRGELAHTWQEMGSLTLEATGWWLQLAYKLAGLNLDLPMINNAEAVVRYSEVDGQVSTGDRDRYSVGMNYYIKSTFIFRAGYDINTGEDSSLENNQLNLQLAYGF